MAYIVKHPKSQFFSAVWRDIQGRQRRRSTKSTNRKEALKIADAFEALTHKQRTARQVRQVMADMHRQIVGEEMAFPTVREFVKSWLERKAPETAPSTHESYRKSTSKFVAHLGDAADKGIDLVTSHHVLEFRNALARTIAPKTANHDLKCLRMTFKAARRDGYLLEDPTENVDTLRTRGQAGTRRPFTIPELQAVMSVADDEWRSMIQFGLYTGARLADVARLRWSNVDALRGEIRFTAAKTAKSIILPLAGPLAEHVATLNAPDDPDAPLHPRAFATLDRTSSGTLSNQFAGLLADAGLRECKSHHRPEGDAYKGRSAARERGTLSFHCLRHTAVSLLKDAGVPASVVMEMVGHDSTQMSEHYTHVGREALAQAAEKMPKIT